MPVTVVVASHPAEKVRGVNLPGQVPGNGKTEPDGHSTRLLKEAAPNPSKRMKSVLQSTVSHDVASKVLSMGNGLVHTCIEAYNRHHHLFLRPDDIWIAIVTQFSFYVNSNAEKMRSFFVAHEGKKELVVTENILDHDFSRMTAKMADQIQDNILDKSLQAWITPSFSTTSPVDTIVCNAALMSTMKHYFNFRFDLLCGIPSVTLLGKVSDWESILQRLDKLASFGPDHQELAAWKAMLAAVLQNMIHTFQDPQAPAAVDFWSKIATSEGGGSGPTYLTGWITAFCVFSNEGTWQGSPKRAQVFGEEVPQLSLVDGATKEAVVYPTIDSKDVPSATCEVDVKITGVMQLDAVMVAGLVGASVFSKNADGREHPDTVQPFPGWWIIETSKEADQEAD